LAAANLRKNLEYRGDLGQATLPEILFTIHRHAVPGVMEASRDGVVKRVWLRSGSVIHASSSDRADSLGAFLRRSGRISAEAFVDTMRERAHSELRYGALLVEGGVLSPAEVYRGIRDQIEEIVWSLFTWESGEITFQISEFEDRDMVRIHLPLPQVILQGVKRAPSARALAARLGRKETVFEPSFRIEDLIEIGLEADEYELIRRVDGRRGFMELCSAGPRQPAEYARLLYAFHVLQLIRRTEREAGMIKIKMKTEGEQIGSA
jgi:hypothetical protein